MSSKTFVQADSSIVIQLALSCKNQKRANAQFYEKMLRKRRFSFKQSISSAQLVDYAA
jgi:hypothetical protein